MTEPIGWSVALLAAAVALFGVVVLTRPLRNGFLKYWLRSVAAVVLFLPAPVPGFESHFAPAFLVLLFEATLQTDGEPARAASLLFAGTLAATVLSAGASFRRLRRRHRRQDRWQSRA